MWMAIQLLKISQTVNVTDTKIPVITTNGGPGLWIPKRDFVRQLYCATDSALQINCSVGNSYGCESDDLNWLLHIRWRGLTITWNSSGDYSMESGKQKFIQTFTGNRYRRFRWFHQRRPKSGFRSWTLWGKLTATASAYEILLGWLIQLGLRSDGLNWTDPYPVGETTILGRQDIHGEILQTEVIQNIRVTDTQIPVIYHQRRPESRIPKLDFVRQGFYALLLCYR